jgi:hypothetical protein
MGYVRLFYHLFRRLTRAVLRVIVNNRRFGMKNLFLALTLAIFCFMSCDDDPDDETNPYPDGVYPFEVSGVKHTQKNTFNYTITWTPPADKGLVGVQAGLFTIITSPAEEAQIYSSVTGLVDPDRFWPEHYRDFAIKKDSFSFIAMPSSNYYVIIKCVDKFGNVSAGVRHDFSWSPD